MVEADVLYLALFPERDGNTLNCEFLEHSPNRLPELVPDADQWSSVVRVIDVPDAETDSELVFHANTVRQHVVCYRQPRQK